MFPLRAVDISRSKESRRVSRAHTEIFGRDLGAQLVYGAQRRTAPRVVAFPFFTRGAIANKQYREPAANVPASIQASCRSTIINSRFASRGTDRSTSVPFASTRRTRPDARCCHSMAHPGATCTQGHARPSSGSYTVTDAGHFACRRTVTRYAFATDTGERRSRERCRVHACA